MKVSKVNHINTAVSVQDSAAKGIMYVDPSKKDAAIQEIGTVYDERNIKVEGQYCILNPASGKEAKRISSIRTKVNELIKKLLEFWVEGDQQITIKKQLEFLVGDEIFSYTIEREVPSNKEIERLVIQHLRKSMRGNVTVNEKQYYLPDIVTKFIIKLKDCWTRHEKMTFADGADSISSEEAEVFLKALVGDWYKRYKSSKKKEKIIRSLESQKVPVKVINKSINKNDRDLLAPSNSTHEKKVHLFSFMRAYAAGSDENRRKMLIAMRSLLTIYLKGEGDFSSVEVVENSFLRELSSEDFLDKDVLKDIDSIKNLQDEVHKKKTKTNKDEIQRQYAELLPRIEEILKGHYRRTLTPENENDFLINKVCNNYCLDLLNGENPKISALKFWLDYFDGEARKTLLRERRLDTYKTGLLWLGKRLWSNWTAYIALKFIDYGKAVYHFALPEKFEVNGEGLCLGNVLPDYKDGISSFEYERLKARDDLDRNTAVAVTFAINTFSRAVLASTPMKWNDRKMREEPVEDILFASRDVYNSYLYEDAGKRILRYFGGASSWENNDEIQLYSTEEKGIELIVPILDQIKDLRNSSFHYLAAKTSTDTEVIRILFDQEKNTYSEQIRKKYFSNNVYRYYPVDNTKELLDFLYNKPAYVPAQVPAFNHLFNRNSAFMSDRIVKGTKKRRIAGRGTDEIEIFKGTLFFLLKEIYYNAFLQDPGCKDRFLALIRQDTPNVKVKNEYALKNFRERIETLGNDATLGEICQLLMTDYEMQNHDKRVRKSRKNDKEIYKHFRSLLYFYLKEAFLEYFLEFRKKDEDKIFAFIREPVINENWKNKSLEGDLSSWTCNTYKEILQDESMLKWYTLAHFLTPKQLNHLIGSYKHYEVFINSIERRAGNTGNRIDIENVRKESRQVSGIVDMLAFSANFCAKTTNTVSDYFKDDEEYATIISNFVSFDKNYVGSAMTALKMFCDNEVSFEKKDKNGKKSNAKQRIGIYYDAYNPIVNRNVVLASMYGDLRLFSDSKLYDQVTINEIIQYYKLKEELLNVFKKGTCASDEDPKKLRTFQNIKNHIEFHDLLTFTEMISDLNAQLIKWSYFRERDLMYMQLGMQYTKLYFTNTVPEDDFRRRISGNGFAFTDGAILYQIVAMYDYSLPLYGFNERGKGRVSVKAGVPISACVRGFVKNYCGEQLVKKNTVYNEGLYFFENIDEHRELVETRNYIDHFKYYANHERSLLDLYSEIYERFFDYSRNFKKSVSYILMNILERYFVVLKTEMTEGERLASNGREERYHAAAKLQVKGICSADFTYTLLKNDKEKKDQVIEKKYQVPARSEQFLMTVKKILEYKVKNQDCHGVFSEGSDLSEADKEVTS